MNQFSVYILNLLSVSNEQDKIVLEIDGILQDVSGVKKALMEDSYSVVNDRLSNIRSSLEKQKTHVKRMSFAVQECGEIYLAAETMVSRDIRLNVNLIEKKYSNRFLVGLAEKYFEEFSEKVGNKINDYIESINDCIDWPERIVAWYDWFQEDLYDDFNNVKSLIEDIAQEYTYRKPELLPKGVDSFFDKLSSGAFLVDIAKEVKNFHETGDDKEAYKNIGFTLYKTIVKEGNKILDKQDNLKYLGVDKKVQSVLLSTITEMPKSWLEGIINYAENGEGTAGSIVVNATIGTFVESVAKAAEPYYKAATAVTYPVIDQLCESVGYDLSGTYEKITGKRGLDAVFQAHKELWVDIVYEGAKENISKEVDGFYGVVKTGWNHWKSGINILLR